MLYFTQPGAGAVYALSLATDSIIPLVPSQGYLDTAVACGPSGGTDDVLVANFVGYYLFRDGLLFRGGPFSTSSLITSLKMVSPGEFLAVDWSSNNVWRGRYTESVDGETFEISGEISIGDEGGALSANIISIATSPQTGAAFVFMDNALWQISPENQLELIAGRRNYPGYLDGRGDEALFNAGIGLENNPIAVGNDGSVYVADRVSGTIREVDADGNVVTIVGNPTILSNDPSNYSGRGDRIRFERFQDIAFDPVRNTLWVVALNVGNRVGGRYSIYRVNFE
jgi:hypothetical protein